MKNKTSFSIYNAAAGSGKTFTLVKEFLKQLFTAKNDDYYKHLLAITFTNKAVAEMKQRIVETLIAFSEHDKTQQSLPMLSIIADETGVEIDEIKARSTRILKNLLHNYAALSVETIDSFNHRLIRTFARDLKLATNFEVTLDIDELLGEAVDLLLSKAGENKEITKVLLDFALEKTDDDKSWDISRDIAKAAKLLFSENDAKYVSNLKRKSLDDFLQFKKQLLNKKKNLSKTINERATQTLKLIEDSGLEHSDFLRKTLPNHFLKLQSGNYNVYNNKLQENLENNKALYKVKEALHIVEAIESITPTLLANYIEIKNLVGKYNLYNAILKNITPLSVINLVNQEIEAIKNDKNIFPISEFNSLINTEIRDQPAPFIYERLGEKYRHFFIDEFQDTSKLQWDNLIPLIDNALSQQLENSFGNLLLVGDAKQSIYRWRGGLPEQFIDLYNNENPFHREKEVFALDTNFRSCEEIINFNNDFFSYISTYLDDENHQKLYREGNRQKCNTKKNGYIRFEFVEKQKKAERITAYSQLALEAINSSKEKGFSESDICILTRTTADGIALSTYLMERGISVISSETLLLQSSPIVQILVFALQLCLNPKNDEAKINLLNLLYDQQDISEDKHTFFTRFLNTSETQFAQILKEFNIEFSLLEMRSKSLFEAFEYCIEKFTLAPAADAYLFGFMDLVFEFQQQPEPDKISFLDFWETKKEKASIPANEGTNAVQLMTIHKAKGLEFPIVIFPFADINITTAKNDQLWYPLQDEDFKFEEAQINFNANLNNYGNVGQEMYANHKRQLELDNVNLLYVTFTRAVEKLYVFAEMPTELKSENPTTYNQLFMQFLKHKNIWNNNQLFYEFGNDLEKTSIKKEAVLQQEPLYFSSNPDKHGMKIIPTEKNRLDEETIAAITAGNLLHNTMAQIKDKTDVEIVLTKLKTRAIIPDAEFEQLNNTILRIVNHPELQPFFNGSGTVYNERNILTENGLVLRPDRINISNTNKATVIDYKTGNPNVWHHDQLIEYANALNAMGFKVVEKILIYSSEEKIVINKA